MCRTFPIFIGGAGVVTDEVCVCGNLHVTTQNRNHGDHRSVQIVTQAVSRWVGTDPEEESEIFLMVVLSDATESELA